MKKIVIAGGGGFVKCIINYIENNPDVIAAYLGEAEEDTDFSDKPYYVKCKFQCMLSVRYYLL